jgi:hypothetical protein
MTFTFVLAIQAMPRSSILICVAKVAVNRVSLGFPPPDFLRREGSYALSKKHLPIKSLKRKLAGTTGLEPATSDVTGRRSNQLNYVPLWCEVRR